MEKFFKVLISNGSYVDETKLQKGLYITFRPTLHDKTETIESMKKKIDSYKKIFPGFDAEKAKENLDKCSLASFGLIRV